MDEHKIEMIFSTAQMVVLAKGLADDEAGRTMKALVAYYTNDDDLMASVKLDENSNVAFEMMKIVLDRLNG